MAYCRKEYTLSWQGHSLELGKRTCIMGVLNATPDSFSDGGMYFNRDKAVEQGMILAGDGADIIDIGGESTRPYAPAVSEAEERDRVIPVIEALVREIDKPISIDTCKAGVAEAALKAGASIINDISALRFDNRMATIAAASGVPVILMHMQGTPGSMQDKPFFNDLIPEIIDFLNASIDAAFKAGIKREMIIIDPGIGFGKNFEHNLEIIRDLDRFADLDLPVLLGPSRKAFIGRITGKEPHERDAGTMAAVAAGILNGAHIVRVHNVKMAVDTARVVDEIIKNQDLSCFSALT
jgi:dihydropteroate synthase